MPSPHKTSLPGTCSRANGVPFSVWLRISRERHRVNPRLRVPAALIVGFLLGRQGAEQPDLSAMLPSAGHPLCVQIMCLWRARIKGDLDAPDHRLPVMFVPATARSTASVSVTEPSTYSNPPQVAAWPARCRARAGVLGDRGRATVPRAGRSAPVAPMTRMRPISPHSLGGRSAGPLCHMTADHVGDQLHRGERPEEDRQVPD